MQQRKGRRDVCSVWIWRTEMREGDGRGSDKRQRGEAAGAAATDEDYSGERREVRREALSCCLLLQAQAQAQAQAHIHAHAHADH